MGAEFDGTAPEGVDDGGSAPDVDTLEDMCGSIAVGKEIVGSLFGLAKFMLDDGVEDTVVVIEDTVEETNVVVTVVVVGFESEDEETAMILDDTCG